LKLSISAAGGRKRRVEKKRGGGGGRIKPRRESGDSRDGEEDAVFSQKHSCKDRKRLGGVHKADEKTEQKENRVKSIRYQL